MMENPYCDLPWLYWYFVRPGLETDRHIHWLDHMQWLAVQC